MTHVIWTRRRRGRIVTFAATGCYADGTALPVPGDPAKSTADATYLSIVADVEAVSLEGEALVDAIGDLDAPFDVSVGGASAQLSDTKEALFRLVPVAGLIATVTFVVLFLMFGSLWSRPRRSSSTCSA